ncbi:MAG: alpha/beta hydrolase [Gammaproteobacteria bacterium]|nr:alpha/beta hydrolase [Gammaproteobacteria bacterium]
MYTITSTTLKTHKCRYLHLSNPGRPAIVVLPGNLQEIESLGMFNQGLSRDFDYYVLELPGTGLNEPLHPTHPMVYLTQCLQLFVEQTVKRPTALLALSYATPIGLEFAKNNLWITQLVLGGSMREIPEKRWPDALALMSNCMYDRTRFAEDFITALSADDDTIPRRKAAKRAAQLKARQYSDEQFKCFIYNSIRIMCYQALDLNKIRCPTLCFTGDLDPYVTKELWLFLLCQMARILWKSRPPAAQAPRLPKQYLLIFHGVPTLW